MKKVNKELMQARILLEKERLNSINSLVNRLETKLATVKQRQTNKITAIATLEASITE